MSDRPLDADSLLLMLTEVGDQLSVGGAQHTLIIVGDAVLVWLGLRSSTNSVDTVDRLDDELLTAVQVVGDWNDLDRQWLIDTVASYRSVTLQPNDCSVVVNHPALLVLAAPYDQLFLTALAVAGSVDATDLATLWPYCLFTSPEDAADAFYDAFPLETRDESLPDRIRTIVGN
jgi:hypothetical protein